MADGPVRIRGFKGDRQVVVGSSWGANSSRGWVFWPRGSQKNRACGVIDLGGLRSKSLSRSDAGITIAGREDQMATSDFF